MRTLCLKLAALLVAGTGQMASAAGIDLGGTRIDFGLDGYADARLVVPSDQTSWMDGGLGKLRYGDSAQDPRFALGEIFMEGYAQINGNLLAVGTVRIEPEQKTFFDITEAYLRYRPVSLSRWRWSAKLGAFFPPVSLENTDIGWMSPWTLTPSAINTWVGEELRTIGTEGEVEWRGAVRTLSALVGLYGWNDLTGILIADRGWAMHDRVTGLIDRPRLPDALARAIGEPIPYRTLEFIEIDRRVGWYAGGAWEEAGLGRIEILRYNNEADPTAKHIQVGWETKFWSIGATTEIDNFVFIAQALRGSTFFQPSPRFFSDTAFESAFLLAGWYIGEEWRLAARADVFSSDEVRPGTSTRLSEHGHALTLAANWLPNDWVRLTAEMVHVDSTRRQRIADGLDPRQTETQIQLAAKLYF